MHMSVSKTGKTYPALHVDNLGRFIKQRRHLCTRSDDYSSTDRNRIDRARGVQIDPAPLKHLLRRHNGLRFTPKQG